jgi:hypothetical protein
MPRPPSEARTSCGVPLALAGLIFGAAACETAASPDAPTDGLNGSAAALFDEARAKLRDDGRFEVRPALEYKKAAVILGPRGSAVDHDARAITFQPNVGLGVGIALQYGLIGAGLGTTLQPTAESARERGHTDAKHLEIHGTRAHFGFDVAHEQYRGFYRKDVDQRDLRPFHDSLFARDGVKPVEPSMRLAYDAIGATYVVDPESFSLPIALDQARTATKSGWSILAMANLARGELTNPTPLVPADRAGDFGAAADVTAVRFVSLGLMPGVGAILARAGYFLNPVGFCGIAVQRVELTGAEDGSARLGGLCDVRGTVGYDAGDTAYGMRGYKTITTTTTRHLNVTHAGSTAQLFALMRF